MGSSSSTGAQRGISRGQRSHFRFARMLSRWSSALSARTVLPMPFTPSSCSKSSARSLWYSLATIAASSSYPAGMECLVPGWFSSRPWMSSWISPRYASALRVWALRDVRRQVPEVTVQRDHSFGDVPGGFLPRGTTPLLLALRAVVGVERPGSRRSASRSARRRHRGSS